jgi:hypothetical protein
LILHVNHEKLRTADGLTRQKGRTKVKKLHLDKLSILEFHEKNKLQEGKYIAMQWENE